MQEILISHEKLRAGKEDFVFTRHVRLVLTDLDPDMTFHRYEFSEKDTICDFNSMLELTSTFFNFLDALFVTLTLCYNLTQLFVTTQMLYS